MAKIDPAVGHFLKYAQELDILNEALALISGGGPGKGGKKRYVSPETRKKQSLAMKKIHADKKKKEAKS